MQLSWCGTTKKANEDHDDDEPQLTKSVLLRRCRNKNQPPPRGFVQRSQAEARCSAGNDKAMQRVAASRQRNET